VAKDEAIGQVAEEIGALAEASLVWADDIVMRAAEKANRQPFRQPS